jgi:hypothetical protein
MNIYAAKELFHDNMLISCVIEYMIINLHSFYVSYDQYIELTRKAITICDDSMAIALDKVCGVLTDPDALDKVCGAITTPDACRLFNLQYKHNTILDRVLIEIFKVHFHDRKPLILFCTIIRLQRNCFRIHVRKVRYNGSIYDLYTNGMAIKSDIVDIKKYDEICNKEITRCSYETKHIGNSNLEKVDEQSLNYIHSILLNLVKWLMCKDNFGFHFMSLIHSKRYLMADSIFYNATLFLNLLINTSVVIHIEFFEPLQITDDCIIKDENEIYHFEFTSGLLSKDNGIKIHTKCKSITGITFMDSVMNITFAKPPLTWVMGRLGDIKRNENIKIVRLVGDYITTTHCNNDIFTGKIITLTYNSVLIANSIIPIQSRLIYKQKNKKHLFNKKPDLNIQFSNVCCACNLVMDLVIHLWTLLRFFDSQTEISPNNLNAINLENLNFQFPPKWNSVNWLSMHRVQF